MATPSPSDGPTATVVVCAYTLARTRHLHRALDAVLAQAGPGTEVLTVVDHNPELAAAVARRYGARVRVLESAERRGLSGARNTGVRAATGDVVVFLDDDAVPEAGWLEALVAPFSRPAVVGVGGAAVPHWQGPPPPWFPEEFLWVVGCSYRGQPAGAARIRNPIGANMAFRREAFERAGVFVHGLGRVGRTLLGCEETEFSIRARRAHAGAELWYVPEARVRHVVTGERATWAYFRRRCWAEGLSKAVVARLQGADEALSDERSYALRTLPAGIRNGLRRVEGGDWNGVRRAAAIVGGLAITTAGYVRGRLARALPADVHPA